MDRLRALFSIVVTALLLSFAHPAAAQQCGTLTTCPFASNPFDGTELFYVVQGGISKKITANQFATYVGPLVPLTLSNGSTVLNGFSNGYVLIDNLGVIGQLPFGVSGGVASYNQLVSMLAISLPCTSTSQLYEGTTTQGVAGCASIGAGLTLTGGVLSASNLAGSVTVQDFYATTNFTPGTTTSLTLSVAPSSASSLAVYFDGVRQAGYTWSLGGTTVTFNSPIPLNTQVVEAQIGTSAVTSSNPAQWIAVYALMGGL